MKLSYCITVCNEVAELQTLVDFLLEHKDYEDEIVILYDTKNGLEHVEEYLRSHSVNGEFFWIGRDFDGHFANHKNFIKNYCKGDYIFQIDADEVPNEFLVKNLKTILASNPDNQVYLVPRVNTVEGLTTEHINRWRWNVDERGWVNYPDYQWRIWKNEAHIEWKNRVHEQLQGFETYAPLPAEESLSLYHRKTIDRQERQNAYYDTLM